MFDPGYGGVDMESHQVQPHHFDCPSCKASFCLQCTAVDDRSKGFGIGHAGIDCEEYKAMLAEDKKFKKRQKKKLKKMISSGGSGEDKTFKKLMKEEAKAGATKPCPGCGEGITHVEGCDHHQCPMCRALFCWNCGSTSYSRFTCSTFCVKHPEKSKKEHRYADKSRRAAEIKRLHKAKGNHAAPPGWPVGRSKGGSVVAAAIEGGALPYPVHDQAHDAAPGIEWFAYGDDPEDRNWIPPFYRYH